MFLRRLRIIAFFLYWPFGAYLMYLCVVHRVSIDQCALAYCVGYAIILLVSFAIGMLKSYMLLGPAFMFSSGFFLGPDAIPLGVSVVLLLLGSILTIHGNTKATQASMPRSL